MARKRGLPCILGLLLFTLVVVLFGCDDENPALTYHSVLFNRNGSTSGTIPVFSINALVDSPVTVPDNTGNLQKVDHQFIGWNTEADGSGNFFSPGEVFTMPFGTVVLYAAWERLYQIGQTGPAGGIIFYDKGSRTSGWRYLEAAPVATEWVNRIWGEEFASDIEGTSDTIGAGKANTKLILDEYLNANFGNYAAFLCAHLEYGGYTDWFLPSSLELHAMYENLYQYLRGSFTNELYWSSTANTNLDNAAYTLSFLNGQMIASSTFYERRVRAIRSF